MSLNDGALNRAEEQLRAAKTFNKEFVKALGVRIVAVERDRDYWRNKYYAAMNNRAREIKCPHCTSTLNFNASMLDTINAACATTPHQPDRIVGQWKLFFSGYRPSQTSTAIVGFAIAYYSDRKLDLRCAYIAAGSDGECRIAMPGDQFRVELCEQMNWYLTTEENFDVNHFIYAKQEALDKLQDFIMTFPGSK